MTGALFDILEAEHARIKGVSAPPIKKTRTQLVADYFREHPNEWIDGLVFAEFAGQYAWRSRISDCRADFGMVIKNRQWSTSDGKTRSEYRYVTEKGSR